MIKPQIFTILILFSMTISYGQKDCSELESNNEKLQAELVEKEGIIATQTKTTNKQKEDIQYYKEALVLMNSETSAEVEDVILKINAITGDSATGKVTVEGILINKGVLRSIQGHKANAFDPKGNEMKSFEVSVGNDKRIDKLLKDVPTKFTVEFEQTVEETPLLTALILDFYSDVNYRSKPLNVVFKNLDVTWE